MKKFLKIKTVWDYICLAAALLALVMLIYYCIQSNADGCFELSVPLLLGFGIVQIGLSLKSHDPSQRANGFLTLAGGVVITFAKEILTLITG